MGNAVLVNIDIERAAEILRMLDQAGLKVGVALWAHLPEYTDWRLILSSKRFDQAGIRGGYELLNRTLVASGFPIEDEPPIMILSTTDPFVRTLRRIFGKAKNVEGMRIGGQTIGNRWVEDGYVYRIS